MLLYHFHYPLQFETRKVPMIHQVLTYGDRQGVVVPAVHLIMEELLNSPSMGGVVVSCGYLEG